MKRTTLHGAAAKNPTNPTATEKMVNGNLNKGFVYISRRYPNKHMKEIRARGQTDVYAEFREARKERASVC